MVEKNFPTLWYKGGKGFPEFVLKEPLQSIHRST
ncbi:Uncharacterised protein [Vibrio cholerae]|nr:Uncharacterised protein [Vibrio cholerae]